MRKVLLKMVFLAVASTVSATDVETIAAEKFLVPGGRSVSATDEGTELLADWGIQWHLNPAMFDKEGVKYKVVFEYFIPETLSPSVTRLSLSLWRTKPIGESAGTGYFVDLKNADRGVWQTGEWEKVPELFDFSGYFYFSTGSEEAYGSEEKIKIRSMKLVPIE